MELEYNEAKDFFAEFYCGEHHFPSKIKKFGQGWSINHYGDLSTFDKDGLTRLVVMAHVYAIRVSIQQAGPNRIKIALHKRKHGSGRFFERHPDIQEMIEEYFPQS